ncbi:hypothetical protein [Chryseobacterium oranimense]|uniref:hypothetical protein n=1 Tax=Chryseobacterium oranimense TaxID=421058 RepID=UPI0031E0630A
MKKIYYLPGLISAVLIPLLFWYYGNKRVHPQYTVMDLGIPAKHKYNDTLDNTLEPYRNWNYKKIVVKPNTAIQNQQYYVLELKKLQARNEKETGIEFIINDHNSYQDFISLMSTMELAQQETFGVDVGKTGHFFAVHFYKDPNKDIYSSVGCTVGGEYHEIRDHINFSDLENLVKNLPKQSFYIIFGFLFLLNFSMLSIKERFQIQY